MLDGRFDILQLFALVAPHQEHAGLDAPRLASGDRRLHLPHGDAAFHGIEDSLRAAFGADPNTEATKLGEQVDDFVVQAVGAGNALERDAQATASHFRGVLAQPAVVNGEDVVGNPNHIGLIGGEQPLDFIDHRERLAAAVGHAKNLMTAPAATIRAAAGGDEGERALAVGIAPSFHVAHHVNRVSCRPWLGVEVGDLVRGGVWRICPSSPRKAIPFTFASAESELSR